MDRARREIQNLQAKRDELRRRLHKQPEHSLNELLNFPSNESRDLPRERRCAFLRAKIMQLQSQLQIYNLAGISMNFNNGKRELQVSLNTAIAGKYHESYTVELSDPSGDAMKLCRQSLPPVVPVEDLSCQFLPRDPSAFIWALSEHLNSFVMRREMGQHTERLLGLEGLRCRLGLRGLQGFLGLWGLRGQFDVVVCADCLFLDDYRACLVQTIDDLLKPCGTALVFSPRRGKTLELFCELARCCKFCIEKTQIYDEEVWEKHCKMQANGEKIYDEDLHYPYMLTLRKASSCSIEKTAH
uniref:centromere protein O-like n=1 Tax=Myxine glutinosa TaxID=7769 RepID=UPI00358DE4CA